MSPPTRDQLSTVIDAAQDRIYPPGAEHWSYAAADAVLALLAEHPDEATLMTRRIRSYLASTVEGAPLRVVLEDILAVRGE